MVGRRVERASGWRGAYSGSEVILWDLDLQGTHAQADNDKILVPSAVLVRALWIWRRRVRGESEANKPGRRVWSVSTADGADREGSKTKASAMAMAMTLAMMAIIFQSIISIEAAVG